MNGIDEEMGYTESEIQQTAKWRPLGDRVLVRVQASRDDLVNGLVIPDTAQEKPLEGLVIAVGKGRIVNGELKSIDVKVDQVVAFGRYSGNEVKLNGEKLLLLQEEELQAVLEEAV